MTKHSWIRHLFARPVARPIRKRPPRARLALEALEDRSVPSPLTVNNLLDDGSAGSLRWAVGQANSNPGDDTINFDPTVFATPQTITLSGTQLELTDTTGTETITGPSAGVTINGGGLSRVFQVDSLVTASISGLTISGGGVARESGGLYNLGITTLTNCTVSGNYSYFAGGILNLLGTLTLTNSTLTGNHARYNGGGISNYEGTLLLTNSTLTGNSAPQGGGIFNMNGTLTLTNCTVSGNSAGAGGGLFSSGTATLAYSSAPSRARALPSRSSPAAPRRPHELARPSPTRWP
jgi:hypothetical protein